MAEIIRGAVHHVDLNVTDLEASRRVYGLVLEFLGYTLVTTDGRYEWDLRGQEGRGASIGLRPCDPAQVGHRHRRYAPGLHHLAWRAESRADVDRLHALLVEHKVPVLDPPAHYPDYSGDYYAVFFEDPDGMKLEVVHAPGWI
ncbi:VOC family protein [Sphingomonas sp.]|uniref:VOC family protein n=1 Tax=Sphingomonas sp. TaxID=28214 RepID=UPI001B1D8E5B|nr:VOC family protein [Sphingomonas sp.]MBO9714422.1 VOC family protein [Sphingomonas sp.]